MRRAILLLPVVALLLPAGAQEKELPPTPTPPAVSPVLTTHPTPAPRRSSRSLAEDVRRSKASATPVPKKRSLGSITNENLKKPEGSSGKGSVQMAPSRPIGSLPAESGSPLNAGTASETEWHARAAQSRERLDAAESDIKRLDLETKRLENDFYAWSDGNYRDRVIKPAWDQAREDLKKARAELDAAQTAQSDLEEEARKSGVSPGWLREGVSP